MASFSIKGNPMAAAVVFVLVFLQLQAVAFAAEAAPSGEEQREFDYFVLALQWPATSCKNPGKCCPSNGCCRGADSPTEFTIHGLWPQYEKGWPSCCSDAIFNENEILSLNEDIQKYWPTYRCGTTSTCHKTKGSFWAHEYEKHGTCAAPVIVGEYDYFLTTLTIFSKYNVTKVLNDAGFVASDTEKYALGDVVAAVQDAFNGATPKISCAKKGAVKELWLCFDKSFEPRDCNLANSCPDFIKLPTYEPQDANRVEGAIPWMADAEAII